MHNQGTMTKEQKPKEKQSHSFSESHPNGFNFWMHPSLAANYLAFVFLHQNFSVNWDIDSLLFCFLPFCHSPYFFHQGDSQAKWDLFRCSACPWRYSCTCPDAAKKGISCKHVHAVLTYFSPEGDMEVMDYEDDVREAVMEDGSDTVEEFALPSNEVRFWEKLLWKVTNFPVRDRLLSRNGWLD